MKIAVIGPSYPFKGGISHYNTLLCKELSKKHIVKLIDYKKRYPSIFYPGETQIDRSENKISFSGLRILNMINPITWLKAFFIIKKFKPRIVIMYWYSMLFSPLLTTISALVKLFTTSKNVVFCHNVIPPEKRPFDVFFEKLFFRYVDYFIVATRKDYNLIKKKNSDYDVLINVHPNYDVFDYGKFNRNSARKKLKIKGKCILMFGYMRKYKGLEILLRAMPLIIREENVKLMIVGEFWGDIEKYKSIADKLGISGNVFFVGRYVDNEEVEIFFKACDVVMIPYVSHTNSGVMQLAFSFNKPVIATDVGGLKDAVIDRGIIVSKDSPKDIAEAVISFYKNKKEEKEFVKNIKKRKNEHLWSELVDAIESLEMVKDK